jgi:hypothetical protein
MFLGNFRAARQITFAAILVQKQLEVQGALGAFRGDSKEVAKKLVLAIWSDVPALRNVEQIPRAAVLAAAVLAAAAMANGVTFFSKPSSEALATALSDSLQSYLTQVLPQLVVDTERLRGVDRELLTRAYAPFEARKPKNLIPDHLFRNSDSAHR